MIEIPAGTRVYGIQLPIQSQSTIYAEPWEAEATADDLRRIAQAADRAGFFYIAVCDHIAIPESLGSTMGTYWQDCITTLSWLGAQTERTALLSHAYVLGIAHVVECVKQLRGTAPAQVPGCEVAVYGGYTGHMASTLVLAQDR